MFRDMDLPMPVDDETVVVFSSCGENYSRAAKRQRHAQSARRYTQPGSSASGLPLPFSTRVYLLLLQRL